MKRTMLYAALMLASAPALARVDACDTDSDYDVALSPEAITFTRDEGSPRRVVMHDGHLQVDGREAELDSADRERVLRFEREARALVPEVRAITLDAVEIAFTALTEVAHGLAPDNHKLSERLEDTHKHLTAQFDQPAEHFRIDEDAISSSVERLVGEITPVLIGEVTSIAVSAALSGDEGKANELERRADRMEKDIEARIKPRADALEERADKLCPHFAELDALDNALTWRTESGDTLDLLRTRR